MYEKPLEKYLISLYTLSSSTKKFCYSYEAAEWLDTVYKTRMGDSYKGINLEAIDVWWKKTDKDDKAELVWGNLYTFVLVSGIYIPYYDWIYEEEYRCDERGLMYFKGGHTCSTGQWDLAKAC